MINNTNKLDRVYGPETKKTLLSRYCDPRMLSAFLPVCNAEQSIEFFKSVKTWLTETDSSESRLLLPGPVASPI